MLQTRQGSLSRKNPSNSTKPDRVLEKKDIGDLFEGLQRIKV